MTNPLLPPLALAEARRTVAEALGRPAWLTAAAAGAGPALPLAELAAHLAQGQPPPAVVAAPELGPVRLSLPAPEAGPLAGEIALVTGGASGIGRATVEALLARGAAVTALDINPAVAGLFPGPAYLGLPVDVRDEAAVGEALATAARTFGGLDMLVLNAGIFPPSQPVAGLTLTAWRRSLEINLDPNVVLLRECHPFLQRAARYGRVVINASKNVLAPGAGAAAYSAAKAALTQLGRVAALEWARDRIRVNMVHPDQVFDTGLWTEEILEARAAHYGLTVAQYKRRNLLGVEITSREVGNFIAEMLGPLFAAITGAQIPLDGGSDRII